MLNSQRVVGLLVALLVVLVPAMSAQGQSGLETVVNRHIAAQERLVDTIGTRMVTTCERTVLTIQRLDARNVANARITPVGQRGLTTIDQLATRNTVSIERRTAALLNRLRRQNADQALVDRVNAALEADRTELAARQAETKAPIVAAVETATSN